MNILNNKGHEEENNYSVHEGMAPPGKEQSITCNTPIPRFPVSGQFKVMPNYDIPGARTMHWREVGKGLYLCDDCASPHGPTGDIG
jgi:hypothetical protein